MPGFRATPRVLPLLAACAVVVAALTGCGGTTSTSSTTADLHGFTSDPVQRVGAVRLPEVSPGAHGAPMTVRAGAGGLLLTYFGYTSCPDVCPTTLADVRQALERLPAGQRRRVSVAMVTVDPRRDTAAQLNGYLRHFFPRWHALRTTDPVALRRAERPFGAVSRIGPTRKDGTYDVEHSAVLYAVDDRGVVRVNWAFGTSAADIAADLRRLLGDRTSGAAA